jgi:hypothetical protein
MRLVTFQGRGEREEAGALLDDRARSVDLAVAYTELSAVQIPAWRTYLAMPLVTTERLWASSNLCRKLQGLRGSIGDAGCRS